MSAKLFSKQAIGNVIIPPPQLLHAWQTDAYPHGERRSWLPAASISLLVVSTLLTILRLVLRLRKRGGGFGLDDAFLVPSWMLLVAFTGVVCWSSGSGTLDRHMWDVDPAKYPTVALSAWLGQLIFLAGTCLIRISILLFYRRMVKGTFRRRWKWSVWAAIGITVTWTLAFCIMLIVTCNPTDASWKVYDPTYTEDWKCADTRKSSFVAGVLAVISDCYSLVLPWSMIWPLEMPKRQKLALNMVFSFGIVVVAAAALRTKHAVALGTDYDSTWVGFWVYFWTMLEWNLAIICNCAPSLRAFFREYLKDSVDKALNSLSGRSKYKETHKSSLASQRAIELKRTYTVESEKPFNVQGSVRTTKDDDADSTSSEQLASLPQAHPKNSNRNVSMDIEGSDAFVSKNSSWAKSNINITCTGPAAQKPYSEV